jgi:WD40 repeat protein
MSQPTVTGGTRAPTDVGATPTIRVFGGVGVDDAGVPISIGGPRQHRLLALLSVRADSVVSVDWLAEYLWDDHDRPDSDLYRGGRLDVAADLLMTDPERLRPLDREFIEASRAATAADVHTEQRRVHRLRGLVVGVAAALVVALVAAGLALVQQRRADDEADRAGLEAGRANASAAVAEEQAAAATQSAAEADVATMVSRSAALDREEPEVALLLALEAHRRAPGPDTEQGLLNALGDTPLDNRVATFERYPALEESGGAGWLSRDGMSLSPVADGMMVRRSLVDDSRVEIGPAPEDSVGWIGDESVNRRVAYSLDETRWWFGPLDGDWEREIDFDVGMYPVSGRTLAANRLVIATQPGRYDGEGGWILEGEPLSDVQLFDGATGEPVGPAIEGLVEPWAVLSADDELIAVRSESSSTFTSGRAYVDVSSGLGGNSAVFLLDADSGEERFRLEIASNVVGLAFGPDGDELYVGTQDGHLLTIDIEQQEVVADVETTATTQLLDVVPLGDRIVVVSAGLAEVVDPRRGPVEGTQIELDNAISGAARADGTLLVTDTDTDMAVYDLDASALAAQVVPIEPGTDPVIGAGETVVLDRRGTFEWLDLTTLERSPLDLTTPSGEAFLPSQIWPDSILTHSPDRHDIARWEDDEVTERVHPGTEEVFGVRPPDPAPLDRLAIVGLRVEDGLYEVSLLDTTAGELDVLLTIEAPGDPGAAPSPGDGLVIVQDEGTLQSYDSSGALLAEGEAGLFNLSIAVTDPATGAVAFGGWFDGGVETGAIIVDPETLAVQEIPDVGLVANLTFLRDGALLAVMSQDGTLRLWDVERARFVRDLWDGRGADPYAALWYDETTDSLWFDGGGNRLVNVSLSPEVWVERACRIVGRDFTQDEWERFVPGDEPQASACR